MNLTECSASSLVEMMTKKQTSPSEVMAAHLDRIERHNPDINALVAMRPREELMAEARRLDGKPVTGPLHGLPWAIKDLLATKGIRSTWGSPIHADYIPTEDALAVARIREAGAIIIGKTNTPEWGHGSHSFNPVYGATCNPYDTRLSAGGSSGGTAAALAARFIPLGDGSDMMGSLRNPAGFCNIYGYRPSWGLVPNELGGDLFLHTMATLGPMARDIEDLVLLLDILAQPHSLSPFGHKAPCLAQNHVPADLNGKRIAWLGDWGGAYPCETGILETCESSLSVLRELGAEIVPLAPPFPADAIWEAWVTLRSLVIYGSKRALWEKPETRELIKPETLWEIENGAKLTPEQITRASQIRSDWYVSAHKLFADYDALVMPTAQAWPFPVEWRWPQKINEKPMDTYHRWMEMVIPVSLIGLAALSVPTGFDPQGRPTGMQIIGGNGSDAQILAMGESYHRATQWPQKAPPRLND
ncbi:amidase [Ochrobactrum sp. CM-21-5]|nr:amidase [Ochrobactrum sp. CM-21-5]